MNCQTFVFALKSSTHTECYGFSFYYWWWKPCLQSPLNISMFLSFLQFEHDDFTGSQSSLDCVRVISINFISLPTFLGLEIKKNCWLFFPFCDIARIVYLFSKATLLIWTYVYSIIQTLCNIYFDTQARWFMFVHNKMAGIQNSHSLYKIWWTHIGYCSNWSIREWYIKGTAEVDGRASTYPLLWKQTQTVWSSVTVSCKLENTKI